MPFLIGTPHDYFDLLLFPAFIQHLCNLWRERVLALACALHGRLGAESPAALLSVYSVRDIGERLQPLPRLDAARHGPRARVLPGSDGTATRACRADPEAAFGGAAVTTEEPLEVGRCGAAACVSVRVRVDKASDKWNGTLGVFFTGEPPVFSATGTTMAEYEYAAPVSVLENHCEPAVRLADGDVVEAWLRRGGRDPNNRGGWLTGIAVNGRLCYTSAVPLPESCTAVYPVIDIYGKTSEITLLQD
eukprot:m51a1_g8891 hypothetical protein (247) ;mRNA; r:682579-687074